MIELGLKFGIQDHVMDGVEFKIRIMVTVTLIFFVKKKIKPIIKGTRTKALRVNVSNRGNIGDVDDDGGDDDKVKDSVDNDNSKDVGEDLDPVASRLPVNGLATENSPKIASHIGVIVHAPEIKENNYDDDDDKDDERDSVNDVDGDGDRGDNSYSLRGGSDPGPSGALVPGQTCGHRQPHPSDQHQKEKHQPEQALSYMDDSNVISP
ncbi:hypothetical protein ElyMa_005656000 [Elysia marginata]|uniref:Uncharacterized protein n=1 Tax=Elysia marginata TaxID=1093978 RepID=A0AAV4FCT0_9GAST|nr:hypothetical protein ElyMa_005656000 [Elysia marginata]